VLNQILRKALRGESLTVYGQGNQIRDYVFVEDVIRAFLAAGAAMDKTSGNHYVIGSGVGYTIAQAINLVADRVALKTGKRVEVIHVEPPSPQSTIESRNFVANTALFQQATGWQVHWSLTEGIDRTIEWCLGETEGS
jgi:nucleoside-diphosphate-sugar epimerase